MYKIFLFLFVSLLSLEARDNPFFPSKDEQDMPLSSNQQDVDMPLKRATITLPSTARTIQSVSVKYKNLDGSIEETKVALHNSIDWHLPLFLSQNYGSSPSEIKTKNIAAKKVFTNIASLSFAQFYYINKELKIITKDEIIRDFLLVKPHRIVVDFKRDIDIRSYEKEIFKSSFTKVKIGNHNGYYRVVIELDGYYRYKLKKTKEGYIFQLL
jgi:hypothetical protein